MYVFFETMTEIRSPPLLPSTASLGTVFRCLGYGIRAVNFCRDPRLRRAETKVNHLGPPPICSRLWERGYVEGSPQAEPSELFTLATCSSSVEVARASSWPHTLFFHTFSASSARNSSGRHLESSESLKQNAFSFMQFHGMAPTTSTGLARAGGESRQA